MTWEERPLSFRLARAVAANGDDRRLRTLAIEQLAEVESGGRDESELDSRLVEALASVPASLRGD